MTNVVGGGPQNEKTLQLQIKKCAAAQKMENPF
jgi:hypothetical protein